MKNANEPAYPSGIDQDGYHPGQAPAAWGLTKREIFAMHAMAGIQSCAGQDMDYEQAAIQAVHCADALLKELEK